MGKARGTSRSGRQAASFAVALLALSGGRLRADELPPSAEEQARLIDAARQVALESVNSLPDFLCTQTIRRYRILPNKQERLRDTLMVEVSFSQHADRYALTRVNGMPPGDSPGLGGALSSGEFGTNLLKVFAAHAAFRFERWTTFKRRPSAVYSYRVAQSESQYTLNYGDLASQKLLSVRVGLRGEVVIDRETHAIFRIQYVSDGVPPSFPIRSDSVVEYAYVRLGDQRYLLPASAVVRTVHEPDESRNEVEFHSYRKFSSETKLTFGDPPPGP